jgi:flagellar assembly protein FliH
MSITHLLENFGQPRALSGAGEEGGDAEFLASFEQGYKAGWDDAIKAKSEERAHVTADLAANLQDLSFTYNEAYVSMLDASKSLIEQIVNKVLPEVARATLGTQIIEQLNELSKDGHDHEAVISASPADVNAISSLLGKQSKFPVKVQSDPLLAEGQVQIGFGHKERQIDMQEVLGGVSDAIAGFFHETQKEVINV